MRRLAFGERVRAVAAPRRGPRPGRQRSAGRRSAEGHRDHRQAIRVQPEGDHAQAGETVKLQLTTEDVTHGFFVKPLGIDEEIVPGKTTEVVVTPKAAGALHDDLRPLLRRRPRRHEDDDRRRVGGSGS